MMSFFRRKWELVVRHGGGEVQLPTVRGKGFWTERAARNAAADFNWTARSLGYDQHYDYRRIVNDS